MRDAPALPHLYTDLASWWPLMSSPADYAEEAGTYGRLLLDGCSQEAGAARPSLLELGSGGGNNASFLKQHFDMVLVDPSDGMLAVSRALNPECEHVQGDMRTVRLERQFDAVFVHDAICCMTSEHDLRQALATAFVHCRPGAVALFCPDHIRENFRPSSDCGGEDGTGNDRRAMRYLEWSWDPDPDDTTYVTDYVYLLREADGTTRTVHDRHVDGLFSREDWLTWLADAGFDARPIVIDHSELPAGSYEVFVGVRR